MESPPPENQKHGLIDSAKDKVRKTSDYLKREITENPELKKSWGEVKKSYSDMKTAIAEDRENRKLAEHNKRVERLQKLEEELKEKELQGKIRATESKSRGLDMAERQYRRENNPILKVLGGIKQGTRAVVGQDRQAPSRPQFFGGNEPGKANQYQFAGEGPSRDFIGKNEKIISQLGAGGKKSFDFSIGKSKFQKGKVPKFI